MPVDDDRVDAIVAAATAVYDDAELAILRLMTARLARGLDEADWQRKRLAEVGQLKSGLSSIVARLNSRGAAAARTAVAQAWRAGAASAITDLGGRGWVPQKHPQAVQALAEALVGELRPLHSQILPQAASAYRNAIGAATGRKLAGAADTRRAAQAAWAALVDDGITGFVDKRGRRWRLSSYVEMATRTAVARAIDVGVIDQVQAAGGVFVYVSNRPLQCSVCLVPGTLIEGPVPTGACRSEYSGDVVRIRTAAGHDLTGTPDHPVLTAQGWRPLKDLRPGDQVISDSREHGAERVMPDHIQVPTRIEEFADTGLPFLATGPVRRDLNSDRAYREIHHMRADSDLLPERCATFTQPFGDLRLVGRIGTAAPLSCCSYARFGLRGACPASVGFVGCGDPIAALLVGGVSPAGTYCLSGVSGSLLMPCGSHVVDDDLMARARPYASAPQIVRYDAAADTECRAELFSGLACLIAGDKCSSLIRAERGFAVAGTHGNAARLDSCTSPGIADADGGARLMQSLAGQVHLDEVIDVGVRQFTGHVWDLQTVPGWFLANRIVTHNCRPWEGKILSITYPARRPAKATVGDARRAGLGHPNCLHTLRPWREGLKVKAGTPDPAADEARARQRYLERGVRRWREREIGALSPQAAAGAKAKVAAWHAELARHVAATGLARQRHREFPGAGYAAPPSRRGDTARHPRNPPTGG
jgi:hypothetical protein